MVLQVDFKSPYHNIRMYLENALVVCDLYGLFPHCGLFSILRGEAFLRYFGLRNPLFTFSERDFSALKLLNQD